MILKKSLAQSLPVAIAILAPVIGCVPRARSPEGKGPELPSVIMREPGHAHQNSQPRPQARGEGQTGTNVCGQRDQGQSWCPALWRAGSWALAVNKSSGHCIMEQGPALESDGCWSSPEKGHRSQLRGRLRGEKRRDQVLTGLACGECTVRVGPSAVGWRALCPSEPQGLPGRGERALVMLLKVAQMSASCLTRSPSNGFTPAFPK